MRIESADYSISVGTSVVLVSEEKRVERVNLTITNSSTGGQVISISTSGEAEANKGIILYPGGHKMFHKTSNQPINQNRVTAISSLAGGSLSVHEEVLQ